MAASAQEDQQAGPTQTSAAQLLQLMLPGDAPLTLILGYMIFTSLALSVIAITLSIAQTFGAAVWGLIAEFPGADALTKAEVTLSLFYVAYVLLAVAAWTATIGLIRRRIWALAWTRSVQVILVLLGFFSLLMNFSPGSFLMFLFTGSAAAGIWFYLAKPPVRGYFE
jgi:hypothetical protein